MAFLAAALPYIQTAATVFSVASAFSGNSQSGQAAAQAGQQQQQAAAFESAQLRQNAITAEAVGQRDAEEQRRQGELIQSRAIALAAAGGGSLTDTGIATLLSRNAGEIAYKSNLALYAGEDRARALRMQAAATDFSGAQAAQGGLDRQSAFQTKAFSDLLGSQATTSLFRKFGGGGPASIPSAIDAGGLDSAFSSMSSIAGMA